MKLKKMNAILGLLSMLLLFVHVGYTVYCYAAMYYNPFLKQIFSYPFIVLVSLHAICGMSIVFLRTDENRMDRYPAKNIRTVLQRLSAVMIFPFLLLHMNMFDLLKAAAAGPVFSFWMLLLTEVLFFGAVFIHAALSFTRALITLGVLSSMKTARTLDCICVLLCSVLFLSAVWFVVKGQIGMFLHA